MMLCVVNRNAGNGRGIGIWRSVEDCLRRFDIPYDSSITRTAEEAEEAVRHYVERNPGALIVVIGGDGTIHRLLPLLVGTEATLGIIPAGSGNDTARGFSLPMDPLEALHTILHGQRSIVDLIDANGQWTLTALATGFDADVAQYVNASRFKRWFNRLGIGSLAYLYGLLHTLFRFQPADADIVVDGDARSFKGVWLAAITNVPYYGGGIPICPDAEAGDGVLDVCVVHGCSRWALLRLFPTVYSGRHRTLPYVTMLRGRQIGIHSEVPRWTYGDGECVSATPLHAAAAQGKLQMMIPARSR
ncbi:diacylglycerol/lipid kinase family protein [Paenibacillus thiaminolyticus]|uniref:diacylglycerol/lipid kinase family protein n=1 Tax=Paenibacillus thiaminolyticus TaxID=49283 RepID=UPI001F0D0CB8|nr:diacylglycerol kinase family protein [Paenibacillus thiaminolyticus]